MITLAVLVILGAFTWRVRGGLRIPHTDKKFPLNKYWFVVFYALASCYLLGGDLNFFFVMLIASRLSSQLYGWESAVGTLITGKITDYDREDCELIDDLLNNVKITIKGYEFSLKKDFPILWAFLWVCLRDLIMTFIIGLALNSIPYMISGVSMGFVYGACGFIGRKVFNKYDKTFWDVAEWTYGACLGLVLYLICK